MSEQEHITEYSLRLYSDDDVKVYELSNEITVGRALTATLVVSDKRVSSLHGKFFKTSSGLCFTDLGSSNGSYFSKDGRQWSRLDQGELCHLSGKDRIMLGSLKSKSYIEVIEKRRSLTNQTQIVGRTTIFQARDLMPDFVRLITDGSEILEVEQLTDLVRDRFSRIFPTLHSLVIVESPLTTEHNPLLTYKTEQNTKALGLSQTLLKKVLKEGQAIWVRNLSEEIQHAESVIYSGYSQVFCVLSEDARYLIQSATRSLKDLPEDVFITYIAFAKFIFSNLKKILLFDQEKEKLNRLQKLIANQKDRNIFSFESLESQENSAFSQSGKLALTELPVLISGESGTGKRELAYSIHMKSPRNTGPFIEIACANLPKDLAMSLLFGHVKGAFTGAFEDHTGYLESANEGTLFIKNCEDLKEPSARALVEAIKNKSFRPLGTTETRKSNFRVIASVNPEEASNSLVYEALEPFGIRVGPLRESPENILKLSSHFLEVYSKEQLELDQLGPEWKQGLLAHAFPGNIRELDSLIQRLVLKLEMGEEPKPQDLGLKPVSDDWNLKKMLREKEHEFILKALSYFGDNKLETSKHLGLTRQALHKKLADFKKDN